MAETNVNQPRRFSRRAVVVFWSAIIAAIVIALLVYQRIDVLYVVATISLVILLAVVANADLEGNRKIKS